MRIPHTPFHWIMVALVLGLLLLALNEAHGQSAGAAATFEGRPAMAGAQAGQGAQAGPPQGGIGVQGSEAAGRELRLRRPGSKGEMPLAATDSGIVPGQDSVKPQEGNRETQGHRIGTRPAQRGEERQPRREEHGAPFTHRGRGDRDPQR